MKRTLSLILAALLLSSSLTACGDTTPDETTGGTTAVETNAPATDPAETEAPTPSYNPNFLTENGIANAHIVLADTADSNEKLAAEDLAYHIKLVSGADIATVNTPTADSISIYVGTPATIPELETLFPEDLAWLRQLSNESTDGDEKYKRYGSDGFAIRQLDGKIYIFGATSRGTMNGVYDFIEENLGVLWTRANEDIGTIYDKMPSIEIVKADYREKSPFEFRGRVIWGNGAADKANLTLMARNKLNVENVELFSASDVQFQNSLGITPLIYGHNVTDWLLKSPLYDPNINEYWETDLDGVHGTRETSKQVNYWSELTADTVAASMIAALDEYKESCNLRYVGVAENDWMFATGVYPEMTEPFEYAPGQFVTPTDGDYFSTVYFTFINRIARQIKEKHPDVYVPTYAYILGLTPPRCELEDNIIIVFCFESEDVAHPINEPVAAESSDLWRNFEKWIARTNNIIELNYYGCSASYFAYERPMWDRVQDDLRLFAEIGLVGVNDAGCADGEVPFWWEITEANKHKRGQNPDYTQTDGWAMQAMSNWIYHKLAWNPEENVAALIDYYCDKVYGEASDEMQEYYRLVRIGWEQGCEYYSTEFNVNLHWETTPIKYYEDFVAYDDPEDGGFLPDKILAALAAAYDAATEDDEKEKIGLIKRLFTEFVEKNTIE